MFQSPLSEREDPQERRERLAYFEPASLLVGELPDEQELILAPRRPPPRRPRPRIQAPKPEKPKKKPPRPKKEVQPRPKARSYPKAKPKPKDQPKVEQSPRPVAMVRPDRRPAARKARGKELDLDAGVSFESVPTGKAMSGHIAFEIGPGSAQSERTPKNLVVVLDVSGSMRLPVERIVTPVMLMMDRLQPADRAVVVAFSDRARVLPSSASMGTYRRLLESLIRASSTNLLVGLEAAQTELVRGRDSKRQDQLVVLTDGLTHSSSHYHESHCLEVCQRMGLPITVLGYGENYNRSLLIAMADRTGGEFTYVYDVAELLEKVMGDVIGLSGVVTRNNRLVVTLHTDIKVARALVLGSRGRTIIRPEVNDNQLEIPLGDLREGETLQVVLEVVLPNGELGTLALAEAEVHYDKPTGERTTTAKSEVRVEYTESWTRPKRNRKMQDVTLDFQKAGR